MLIGDYISQAVLIAGIAGGILGIIFLSIDLISKRKR